MHGAVPPFMEPPRQRPDRWTSGHNGSQIHRALCHDAGQISRLSPRGGGTAAGRWGSTAKRPGTKIHTRLTRRCLGATTAHAVLTNKPLQTNEQAPKRRHPYQTERAHAGHGYAYACKGAKDNSPHTAGNPSLNSGCVRSSSAGAQIAHGRKQERALSSAEWMPII